MGISLLRFKKVASFAEKD